MICILVWLQWRQSVKMRSGTMKISCSTVRSTWCCIHTISLMSLWRGWEWPHSYIIPTWCQTLCHKRKVTIHCQTLLLRTVSTCNKLNSNMSHLVTKPKNWHVLPAKTQISLGICPVWSESSLCAQCVAKDPSFLLADNEDSDQTWRMPRLIWVYAGRTCHFVGFVMRRYIFWQKMFHSS